MLTSDYAHKNVDSTLIVSFNLTDSSWGDHTIHSKPQMLPFEMLPWTPFVHRFHNVRKQHQGPELMAEPAVTIYDGTLAVQILLLFVTFCKAASLLLSSEQPSL